MGRSTDLFKLHELHQRGALTADEYQTEKHKILNPVKPALSYSSGAKSKTAFILLGIFLGMFGIHNFYLGFHKRGIAQLIIFLAFAWTGVGAIFLVIWVVVELLKTVADADGNLLE